ncbi:hypothetical protein [Haladaptatus sp. DFWS20]|uniref:hypothetical protein n=1 Tax=Haladaptatus sp. DFWS20 TaxID=3403467 RepID=UPI003EB8233B
MTGMKEGAGENPFAEDTPSTETEPDDQPGRTDDTPAVNSGTETNDTDCSKQPARQQSMQIPYKFRRDGVQDGRDRVPLFLQKDTKSAERDALRELEDRFGDDVSLTDLREALMKVGLQHLDEAEIHLEEWGYGMTFD